MIYSPTKQSWTQYTQNILGFIRAYEGLMAYKLDKNKFNAIKAKCGFNQKEIAYHMVALFKGTEKSWRGKISRSIYDDDPGVEKKGKRKDTLDEHEVAGILSFINEKYDTKFEIHDLCKCETAKPSPPIVFWKVSDIYKYYESLGENDVISIVSFNGFLEADNPELLDQMLKLARKKVEIRYYYPENSENKSLKDYASLKEQYGQFLSSQDVESYIWGFAVPLQFVYLFGWNTRYIIISQWIKNREQQVVQNALLYTETASSDESSNESMPIWIRLSDDNGQKYYSTLCKNAEPVRDIGIYQSRLDPILQKAYQSAFSNRTNLNTYRNICNTIDPKNQTLSILTGEVNKRVSVKGKRLPKKPIFNVLDIGSGDGHLIDSIVGCLQSALGKKSVIQLSCIESANIPQQLLSQRLKDDSVLHEMKTFEEYDFYKNKYNLIFSIHSSYLMDSSYLLKMYELLDDNGHLFVVTSPYEDNVINKMCGIIDRHIVNSDDRIYSSVYEGKIISDDPLRNYAEDIEACAINLFNTVEKIEFISEISLSEFISNGTLTDFSKNILSLFNCSRLSKDDIQNVYKECKAFLDINANNGHVVNKNWILIISKQEVRRCLSKLYNGIVNS